MNGKWQFVDTAHEKRDGGRSGVNISQNERIGELVAGN